MKINLKHPVTDRVARLGMMFAVIITSLSMAGCWPEDEIVRHRVPKSLSGLDSLRETASEPSATVAVDRMVVAMYELENATWFFKINGPTSQVRQAETQWRQFFENLKFENGQPSWDLPEGWSEGDQRPMRFATLTMGEQDPPLEMAISSLGPDQDRLLNVNRWRGQMGLDPVQQAGLDSQLEKLKNDAGQGWLFDVEGKSSGSMAAPFANRGRPPIASDSQPTTSDSDLKFESPEGWVPGNTSRMVPVRLSKSAGEAEVQLTVIQLPAAVNEWKPNVDRWANELGLSSLSEEQLTARTSEVEIDGQTGNQVRLVEDDKERATIAAMVKHADLAWFIKLTGDRVLVAEEEATFQEFMKTLKFPSQ